MEPVLTPLRPSRLQRILERLVADLREGIGADHLQKVVLTGSYALCEAEEGSDINLFLFLSAEAPPEVRDAAHAIAYEQTKADRFAYLLGINFITPEDYRAMEEAEAGLYHHISACGKVVG